MHNEIHLSSSKLYTRLIEAVFPVKRLLMTRVLIIDPFLTSTLWIPMFSTFGPLPERRPDRSRTRRRQLGLFEAWLLLPSPGDRLPLQAFKNKILSYFSDVMRNDVLGQFGSTGCTIMEVNDIRPTLISITYAYLCIIRFTLENTNVRNC